MKLIREYYHLHESYIEKSLLEAEGITVFVQNENSFSVKPDGFQPSIGLLVSEEDFDRASKILLDLEESE